MKILFGYAIILGFLISFCNCYNFSVAVDPYHKEIYKFVKQIITDWNQKHENTINDISIINMDNDTSLFHIVRKAVQKENTVLLPDCIDQDRNTRVSSIMIIIVKILASLEYYVTGLFGCIDSGFWSTQSKVIVIPSSSDTDTINVTNLCLTLTLTRTLNFIIPGIENGKITNIYKSDMLSRNCIAANVTHSTDKLFSNSLSDMKGYTYTAIGNKADKSLSPEIKLMETIAKAQNARLNVSLLDISRIYNYRLDIEQGTVDMLLNVNSLIDRNNHLKKVNTYEVNGYCSLVPISDDSKDFFEVTVHPFKREVWFYLKLSILSAGIVWNLYKRLSIHRMNLSGYIACDLISAFLQQSVKTRAGPLGLKIMLQLFIFMMIVIGNVYQGMIISSLMDQRNYNKFSNVKGLFSMKYEFYADELFIEKIKDSITYKENANKINSISNGLGGKNYTRSFQKYMTIRPKNVFIVRCDSVLELLSTRIDNDTKARDVYRELPQKVFVYYKKILLTYRSPFYEKLSEMTLRIHESGIKQHWQTLRENSRKSQNQDSNNDSMLKLMEIKPVLQLHFHGMVIAGYTCLLEVLWSKFVKNYIRRIYRRYIKKCLKGLQKYRNRKVGPRLQQIRTVEATCAEEDNLTCLTLQSQN